jgi:hypothetical protein
MFPQVGTHVSPAAPGCSRQRRRVCQSRSTRTSRNRGWRRGSGRPAIASSAAHIATSRSSSRRARLYWGLHGSSRCTRSSGRYASTPGTSMSGRDHRPGSLPHEVGLFGAPALLRLAMRWTPSPSPERSHGVTRSTRRPNELFPPCERGMGLRSSSHWEPTAPSGATDSRLAFGSDELAPPFRAQGR